MKNLQKRREALGVSRWELSKRSGVSPNTIQDIERHGVRTNVEYALKLAQALGTTVEDLMGEKVAS